MVLDSLLYPLRLNANIPLCGGGAAVLQQPLHKGKNANKSASSSSNKNRQTASFRKEGCGLFMRLMNAFVIRSFITGASRAPPPYIRLFIPLFFDKPLARIVFNILPYFLIISLITNHMIVIGTLENRFTNFFVTKPFEG